MAKPTRDDAEILIQLSQLGAANGVSEAMNFLFSDKFIPSYAEFVKKYPHGSEQYNFLRKIAVQYETLGTFTKHGLVNEDLVFDLHYIPWERMKAFVLAQREESGEPRMGENFEWLGRRQEEWQKAHPPLVATQAATPAGIVAHPTH